MLDMFDMHYMFDMFNIHHMFDIHDMHDMFDMCDMRVMFDMHENPRKSSFRSLKSSQIVILASQMISNHHLNLSDPIKSSQFSRWPDLQNPCYNNKTK